MEDKRAHIIGGACNIEKEGTLQIAFGDMGSDVLFSAHLISEKVATQIETKSADAALACLANSPLNFGKNMRPSIQDFVSSCKSDEKGKKLVATQHCRKALCERVAFACLGNSPQIHRTNGINPHWKEISQGRNLPIANVTLKSYLLLFVA